jgi:hypothetical protein
MSWDTGAGSAWNEGGGASLNEPTGGSWNGGGGGADAFNEPAGHRNEYGAGEGGGHPAGGSFRCGEEGYVNFLSEFVSGMPLFKNMSVLLYGLDFSKT